jgi:aminoglycoside phosphotransferase (APT) family kinase protein
MATETGLPGIDVDAVTAWFVASVPGTVAPLRFSFVAGGRSNLTYRVADAAGATWVLRRPPTGNVLATAHDMGREYRFLTALHPTAVPVAEPVAMCADADVTGAPFYVMGFVDGVVLASEQDALTLPVGARAAAADSMIDTLVDLHAVDPTAVGLGSLARPGSFLGRQLRRWHRQVHATGGDEGQLALLDEVHDRLVAQLPPSHETVIAHGDYRAGNLAVDRDGVVRGVFDWELATLGDALADLGWLLSTWTRPGDPHPATTSTPSMVPGFPSAGYLIARYAQRSGRDVGPLPYYVAFARWRGACIWHGVSARYRAGVMGDDGSGLEDPMRSTEPITTQAQAALDDLAAPR